MAKISQAISSRSAPNGRVRCQTRRRAGFSLLELEIAVVIFGIALSGLAPHTVMYIKHLDHLQDRFSPEQTYYLVPSSDQWARKLGAAATVTTVDPGAVTVTPGGLPANEVRVTSLEKSLTGEEATAYVTVGVPSP